MAVPTAGLAGRSRGQPLASVRSRLPTLVSRATARGGVGEGSPAGASGSTPPRDRDTDAMPIDRPSAVDRPGPETSAPHLPPTDTTGAELRIRRYNGTERPLRAAPGDRRTDP